MNIPSRIVYEVLAVVALCVGALVGWVTTLGGGTELSWGARVGLFSLVTVLISLPVAGFLFGLVGLVGPAVKEGPGVASLGSKAFRRLIFGIFVMEIVLGFSLVSSMSYSPHPVQDGIFGRGELAGGMGLAVWMILYTRPEKVCAFFGLIILLMFTMGIFAGKT